MSQQHHASPSVQRPAVLRLPGLRLTHAHLWRCALVALMTLTFAIGSYSTLVPQVQAASHGREQKTPVAHAHPPKPLLKPVHPLVARVSHQRTSLSPHVSGTTPFDGLGQLPFYTYITHPITSPTCTCGKKELLVNVANGNLIMGSD